MIMNPQDLALVLMELTVNALKMCGRYLRLVDERAGHTGSGVYFPEKIIIELSISVDLESVRYYLN